MRATHILHPAIVRTKRIACDGGDYQALIISYNRKYPIAAHHLNPHPSAPSSFLAQSTLHQARSMTPQICPVIRVVAKNHTFAHGLVMIPNHL